MVVNMVNSISPKHQHVCTVIIIKLIHNSAYSCEKNSFSHSEIILLANLGCHIIFTTVGLY